MDLSPVFFLFAVPAVLIAAVSKGGFGSGAAFLAGPIMAMVLEPAEAVGVLLPLLMVMDIAGLKAYWRKWHWPQVKWLMLGMVPGVVAGWLVFAWVSADGLRLLVGALAIGFVFYQIAQSRGWVHAISAFATPLWGNLWGVFAGFTSFVAHAGGPPAAMYLMATRIDKTRFQASTVLAFWWVNLLKFPAYIQLGIITTRTAQANILLAPVAILGVWMGYRAHRFLPEKWFFRLTYLLLFLTGTKLIIDAMT